MKYKLVDGSTINLSNIYEVSEIKDLGSDDKTIDECTLSFTIRFKVGRSKMIHMNYHYNEWFDVYKELKALRNDIIENWKKHTSDKD